LRFWNSRLRREKDSIRDVIWRALQKRSEHPLPNYCRPMIASGQGMKPAAGAFPSPQPSPPGKGGGKSGFTRKPATGYAGLSPKKSASTNRCSLSPGERAGVRGNGTNNCQRPQITF
jgi:hypothetical protein